MHVIWDWNGTLFDDLHIVVAAVNASLRAIDAPLHIDADGYRDHYQRPVRGFYDVMLGRKVTDAEWDVINVRFHDTYLRLVPMAAPSTDARAAAAEVARRRRSQSILSMWTHELLVPTVVSHRLDMAMVAVRGSDAAQGERKEALLRRHLTELPVNGESKVVMVGDTLDDAAAAAAAGIGAVLYNGGSHHRSDLEATGLPIADSLVEAVDLADRL